MYEAGTVSPPTACNTVAALFLPFSAKIRTCGIKFKVTV